MLKNKTKKNNYPSQSVQSCLHSSANKCQKKKKKKSKKLKDGKKNLWLYRLMLIVYLYIKLLIQSKRRKVPMTDYFFFLNKLKL